jgi:hypothetical protein
MGSNRGKRGPEGEEGGWDGRAFFDSFFSHHKSFVHRRTITKEHDLRAGSWEDGIGIIVMTDNYHEYCEHCTRWRASVFFHVADTLARRLREHVMTTPRVACFGCIARFSFVHKKRTFKPHYTVQ